MCYLSSVLGILDIAKLYVSCTSRVSSKLPSINGNTKSVHGFSVRIRLVYILTVKQNRLKTVSQGFHMTEKKTPQNKNKNSPPKINTGKEKLEG